MVSKTAANWYLKDNSRLLTVLTTSVNPCLHLLVRRNQVVMHHGEILELGEHLEIENT